MPALHENLRKQLEKVVIEARDTAEAAARAALQRLAVDNPEPFKHQTPDQRQLRNQLRARARQLGDLLEQKKQAIDHLTHELAYEHWHRMLFARFLAENGLLIHPDLGVPVTLAECEDLAKEEAAATKAKADAWALAGRFASKMLPQIFRTDDPLLQITLAPEDQQALEKLLVSLAGGEHGVFTADDSLGWVYQFWQSKRKDEVNASGDKITGDTLPAVTQLFTEHYMVLFLMHNTVGAWHAGKVLAANPKIAQSATSEDALRKAVSLDGYSFDYLRFVRANGGDGPWRPAAGSFDGWPKTAAELKMLDPCCGSGHFLVAGFDLLINLRVHEEGLSNSDAAHAVLRDNIYGLELDLRCTQIAAFNLAIAAWKLAGYRPLPPLNIACTGIAPRAKKEKWLELAHFANVHPIGRAAVQNGLELLWELFQQAPTLGSLLSPESVGGNLIAADWQTLAPVVMKALEAEQGTDDERAEAVVAQGLLKAAELLAGPEQGYTLVITNVPYLGRGKQDPTLQKWAEENEQDAKADLATVFISRSFKWLAKGGNVAVVSPQAWLSLTKYQKVRQQLLRDRAIRFIASLGEEAWRSFGNRGPRTVLVAFDAHRLSENSFLVIDAATSRGDRIIAIDEKDRLLRGDNGEAPQFSSQSEQLGNHDFIITLGSCDGGSRLSEFVFTAKGVCTGDIERFVRSVHEVHWGADGWVPFRDAPSTSLEFTGCDLVLKWDDGGGHFVDYVRERLGGNTGAWIRGGDAWGRRGVSIRRMAGLSATQYLGEMFTDNGGVVIPFDEQNLPAILAFASSDALATAVAKLNQKLSIDNAYLKGVPFDLAHWQSVAVGKYPNGLPEPESDDPTQWLFHGRPEACEPGAALQVSVARLAGYRWPAELDETMRLSSRARGLVKRCDALLKFADDDGIFCIPSVRGEERAADRLAALLAACGITPDRDLDDYLRNSFFEDHFKLFGQRPFVWHIWDGRKHDGFHAMLNYHKLADGKKGRKLLETLTHSYLGDWIARQKADVKAEKAGAEARLVAALDLQKKLEAIAVGETPFDIFVRWKPLHEQPIGWEPDINDGVRMNIRPFAEAGILRKSPNVKWGKDRGKDLETAPWFSVFKGERINDHHLTNAEKLAAREAHQSKEAKAASGRKR